MCLHLTDSPTVYPRALYLINSPFSLSLKAMIHCQFLRQYCQAMLLAMEMGMSNMDMNNTFHMKQINLKLNFPVYFLISYSLLLPVDRHSCTEIHQLTICPSTQTAASQVDGNAEVRISRFSKLHYHKLEKCEWH